MSSSNKKIAGALCISAGIYSVAYWTPGIGVLMLLFPVPLIHVLPEILTRKFFGRLCWGAVWGILYLLVGLPSLLFVTMTSYDHGKNFFLIFGKVSLLFLILSGLFGFVWGAAFGCVGWIRRRTSRYVLAGIIFPCVWVSVEVLLRVFTFGFDWWFAGIALVESPLFRGIAVLGGAPLLSLYVMITGAAFYIFIHETWKVICRSGTMLTILLLSSAGLIFGIVVHYGRQEGVDIKALPRMAILQTNVDFPASLPLESDSTYRQLVFKALHGGAMVIVFPGQILPRIIERDSLADSFWRKVLGNSLVDQDVLYVLYFPVREKNGMVYQTMFAIRKGKIEGEYKKETLFPVSDYAPPGVLGQLFADAREYSIDSYRASPFSKNGILTREGSMGALICNEAFLPSIVSRIIRQGTGVIIQSGSDKPFISDAIFTGTLRMAQVRALQANVWWLRANKTGISAIISPAGDILAKLDRNKRGVLYFSP